MLDRLKYELDQAKSEQEIKEIQAKYSKYVKVDNPKDNLSKREIYIADLQRQLEETDNTTLKGELQAKVNKFR